MGHRLLGSQFFEKNRLPVRLRNLPTCLAADKVGPSPKSRAMTQMTRPETHQNLIYGNKEHTSGFRQMPTAERQPSPRVGCKADVQPISDLLCDENEPTSSQQARRRSPLSLKQGLQLSRCRHLSLHAKRGSVLWWWRRTGSNR
jgi:hypothetical protein